MKVVNVIVEPTKLGGWAIGRLVDLEGGSCRVETWRDGAWVPGGTDIGELFEKPPASAELLAVVGLDVDLNLIDLLRQRKLEDLLGYSPVA